MFGSRFSFGHNDRLQPLRSDRYAPLDVQPAKTPGKFRLMGDTVTSEASARAAFQKGQFMYQFRGGTSGDDKLHYCRVEADLTRLCSLLVDGRKVVIRHLQPNPPPVQYKHVERPIARWW